MKFALVIIVLSFFDGAVISKTNLAYYETKEECEISKKEIPRTSARVVLCVKEIERTKEQNDKQ